MGKLAASAALVFFAGLAALPFLYSSRLAPPPPVWAKAAKRSSTVPLPQAPASLAGTRLARVAQPTNPNAPPASLPNLDANHVASLVAAEDNRLRTVLHASRSMTTPTVMGVTGSLSTLVLPSRPAAYSFSDLQNAQAIIPHQGGGYELVDSILVAPGATLTLDGASLPAGSATSLYLDRSAVGFTSLVAWGGSLKLTGIGAETPLAVTGWDRDRQQPAADGGNGRPYIREVGGRMDLVNVRVSSLGFWSGRTGGVAWTGVSRKAATGSAVSSTFTGNAFGAFVSRADQIQFSDDLFEANELDGLRLHRNTTNSTVSASAAARNGGNGFSISRGATGDALRGDLAVHNRGNGFLLDGEPLVTGASPSGSQSVASVGTLLEASEAEASGRAGIIVEGGTGTVVRNNVVCGPVTAIAVRAAATGTMIVGNDIHCGGRVGLSIGPAVTGTTVDGNTVGDARIGLMVRNSPGVRIMNNRFTRISIFAISVRGSSPGVVGNGNVMEGQGFTPVDTRSGAVAPVITTSDTSSWTRRASVGVLGYLRYHPILITWIGILLVVIISTLVMRARHRPQRPYAYYIVRHPAPAPMRSPAVAPDRLPEAAAQPLPEPVAPQPAAGWSELAPAGAWSQSSPVAGWPQWPEP